MGSVFSWVGTRRGLSVLPGRAYLAGCSAEKFGGIVLGKRGSEGIGTLAHMQMDVTVEGARVWKPLHRWMGRGGGGGKHRNPGIYAGERYMVW